MKRLTIILALLALLVGAGGVHAHGAGAFAAAYGGYNAATVVLEPTNAVFLPSYSSFGYSAAPCGSFSSVAYSGFSSYGYGAFAGARRSYGAFRAVAYAPVVAVPTVVFSGRSAVAVAGGGAAAAASSGSRAAAASASGGSRSFAATRVKRNGTVVSKAASR